MNKPSPVSEIVYGSLSEYGEAFLGFLEERNIYGINVDKIRKKCIQLEENHGGRTRLTGEYKEYHSHLYEVAKLYIELGGDDISEEGIIIALRHDDIEDLTGKIKDGIQLKKVSFNDIAKKDGEIIALCIQALSKPKPENKSEQAKRERDGEYYPHFHDLNSLTKFIQEIAKEKNISISGEKAGKLAHLVAIIKMCDRIHNLRTMPDEYPVEKRERKTEQTEKDFVSLAQSLGLSELRDKLIKSLIYSHRTQRKIATGHTLRTH